MLEYCRCHRNCTEDHPFLCTCPCGCGGQSDYFVMGERGLCICCDKGTSHEVPPQSVQPVEELIKQHESILAFLYKVKDGRDMDNTFSKLAEEYKDSAGIWSFVEYMYREPSFNALLNAFRLCYISDVREFRDSLNVNAVGTKEDLISLMAWDLIDNDYPFWPLRELIGDGPEIPDEDCGKIEKILGHWRKWITKNGYLK